MCKQYKQHQDGYSKISTYNDKTLIKTVQCSNKRHMMAQ